MGRQRAASRARRRRASHQTKPHRVSIAPTSPPKLQLAHRSSAARIAMLRRVFLQSQLLAIFTTLLGTWTANAQSTDLPLWKTGILGPPIRIDRTEPVSVHANLVTHDA